MISKKKLIGKKIKGICQQQSKSLNEFIFSKGYLTTATGSRIKNGLYDIKFSTLLKISKMLDLKVEELINFVKLL